jgi:hypothetical protein
VRALEHRLAVAAVVLSCGAAHAQGAGSPEPAAPTWAFAASAYLYLVPDAHDYVQPTLVADRDWLHVAARYNYEDLETASAWVGYNLAAGRELTLELTPMVGAVFGGTAGIAPGYLVTLAWRRLELYGEGEWVLDLRDRTSSFFYAWSELTVTPVDWLRAGIVGQRTRVYASERDLQRGLLVGLRHRRGDMTAHVLNPDTSEPVYVLSVGVEF